MNRHNECKEKLLKKEDCFQTLKISLKGKCLGSDGFTVEFYIHFCSLLGEEMVQSFNQALLHGPLYINGETENYLWSVNLSAN